jgi:transposase
MVKIREAIELYLETLPSEERDGLLSREILTRCRLEYDDKPPPYFSAAQPGARKFHITGATVGKWRERFRESGLEGLLDEPRVGAPRKITDQQNAIVRIWRAFRLQPHRVENFKFS